MKSPLFSGILLALLATSSHAHHIWLEQHGDQIALYFGEFGQNLREASPGVLDKLTKPNAQLLSANQAAQPIALSKQVHAYQAKLRLGKGASVVVTDPDYPIFERKQGEQVIRGQYVPAARLLSNLQAQAPTLSLDVVPTGQISAEGTEFQVWFKQQPLAKVEVELWTASGWKQTLRTNAEGKIKVSTPWKGAYVLELNHKEQVAGQKQEQAFDHSSYTTAVTFYTDKGLPSLAAKPALPAH